MVGAQSHRQIGIVSFGVKKCLPGLINVFTNIGYYYDWIRQNVVI